MKECNVIGAVLIKSEPKHASQAGLHASLWSEFFFTQNPIYSQGVLNFTLYYAFILLNSILLYSLPLFEIGIIE